MLPSERCVKVATWIVSDQSVAAPEASIVGLSLMECRIVGMKSHGVTAADSRLGPFSDKSTHFDFDRVSAAWPALRCLGFNEFQTSVESNERRLFGSPQKASPPSLLVPSWNVHSPLPLPFHLSSCNMNITVSDDRKLHFLFSAFVRIRSFCGSCRVVFHVEMLHGGWRRIS